MIKRPVKNEKNIITEWEEVLYETPQLEAKEVFKEQKIKNEIAALKRAKTIKSKKINPLPENPYMEESTSGISVSGKPVNIISTNLPSTDLVVVVNSLIKEFEENICDLKKTTKPKFIKYCQEYSKEYIMTILEVCAESGIKSFAGFRTVIETHIKNKNDTPEKIRAAVEKYRQDKKNKQKVPANRKQNTSENFKQRDYNFGDLEKMLLNHMNYEEDEE